MWILGVLFFGVFLAVTAAIMGIFWAVDMSAEVRKWKQRHESITESLNDAAWRANKSMIMH